jgi:hypothetical protein
MVTDFSLCGITEFLNILLTCMSDFSKQIFIFGSKSLKLLSKPGPQCEIIQIMAKSRAAGGNDSPTYSVISSKF